MSSNPQKRLPARRTRRAQYGRPTYNRPARIPPSGPPRTFSTIGKRGSTAAPAPGGDPALLLEDGSYLLLEDGSNLLLEG